MQSVLFEPDNAAGALKPGATVIGMSTMSRAVDAADAMAFPLPLGSAAHQLYKAAAAQGWTQLDDSILIRLMEQLAGRDASDASAP